MYLINCGSGKATMKLNCDLGESFGAWHMTADDKIMPFVDMASIACGFHAGDPLVMQRAIHFAKLHKVTIGAHPSYPDLQGFGRRSMKIAKSELIAVIHYQIAALQGMAKCQGRDVEYVKPHGALYNDMMADEDIFDTVLQAIKSFNMTLPLVVQSTTRWQYLLNHANNLGVDLWFEAFADRRYQDDGSLLARTQPGAVLTAEQMYLQVKQLVENNQITTVTGANLTIKADTLCVHGDNQATLECIESIRSLLATSGN